MRDRVVLSREEIGEGARARLNQQDLATRADGVGDLDVQRDFQRPAGVRRGIAGASGLVDLLETTVRGGDFPSQSGCTQSGTVSGHNRMA